MDRAKYRGLRTDGQGWVYGFYWFELETQKHWIIYLDKEENAQRAIEVIPETVGQLWKPSVGLQVFGGDLVEAICAPSGSNVKKVRRCKIIDSDTGFSMAIWHKGEWWAYSSMDFNSIKVIGIIHEKGADT